MKDNKYSINVTQIHTGKIYLQTFTVVSLYPVSLPKVSVAPGYVLQITLWRWAECHRGGASAGPLRQVRGSPLHWRDIAYRGGYMTCWNFLSKCSKLLCLVCFNSRGGIRMLTGEREELTMQAAHNSSCLCPQRHSRMTQGSSQQKPVLRTNQLQLAHNQQTLV